MVVVRGAVYWLRTPGRPWRLVTKESYIDAEIKAGFRGHGSTGGEPVTSKFSGYVVFSHPEYGALPFRLEGLTTYVGEGDPNDETKTR